MPQPSRIIEALKENIAKVIVGKDEVVHLALIAMLCGGHVLIEDVPGVGKTTLCSALARSLACSFKRIQFTPDVIPSDITGFSVANMQTGAMEYRPGAVMSQIVLADEINRTSPKTQSALLEVMEEHQVTVDGTTYRLPEPFMVLATQNPVDFVGTYPLPEAQMDRFFMRIAIGYPSVEDVIAMQQEVKNVYCSREVRSYVANLCAATRTHPALQLGVSTRAAIALIHAAQATALLDGRDFILPDDVQQMAHPVLCHRMILGPEARMKDQTAQQVLTDVLARVKLPVKLP